MLFNSIDFGIFVTIVFLLYWFVFNKLRLQNIFILVASYTFYAFWDWRFLLLILLSTCVDFLLAKQMNRAVSHRKRVSALILSLTINLGLLFVFKYYNFFIESLSSAFSRIKQATIGQQQPTNNSFAFVCVR